MGFFFTGASVASKLGISTKPYLTSHEGDGRSDESYATGEFGRTKGPSGGEGGGPLREVKIRTKCQKLFHLPHENQLLHRGVGRGGSQEKNTRDRLDSAIIALQKCKNLAWGKKKRSPWGFFYQTFLKLGFFFPHPKLWGFFLPHARFVAISKIPREVKETATRVPKNGIFDISKISRVGKKKPS